MEETTIKLAQQKFQYDNKTPYLCASVANKFFTDDQNILILMVRKSDNKTHQQKPTEEISTELHRWNFTDALRETGCNKKQSLYYVY